MQLRSGRRLVYPPPEQQGGGHRRRSQQSSEDRISGSTIRDLSDDLLREILLRLPSLPSLVRAVLTCRAFLAAVRSSPAFRRRFRSLHPPPLLGFFLDSEEKIYPTFTRISRGSDRDHAAALHGLDRDHAATLRRLDAFLTRVPQPDDVCSWQTMECCGGCLLLLNWYTMQLAVYNPLTGALDIVPAVPDDIKEGHSGGLVNGDLFLVIPDDEASDRNSFRVVSSCYDKSRVRVAVFSSATRKWHILPWSEPVPTQPSSSHSWLDKGEQVNGFLCWLRDETAAFMVLLDTVTLRFSVIDMPDGLSGQVKSGDTKDGKLCVVVATDFTLSLWFRTPDDDGVDKWVLQNVLQLEEEVLELTNSSRDELEQLEVLEIRDGIVYMTPFGFGGAESSWYLSFCLETRKLEKLICVKAPFNMPPHRYVMPWPASLAGSHIIDERERERERESSSRTFRRWFLCPLCLR